MCCDNEFKQRKIKLEPRVKLNHNIYPKRWKARYLWNRLHVRNLTELNDLRLRISISVAHVYIFQDLECLYEKLALLPLKLGHEVRNFKMGNSGINLIDSSILFQPVSMLKANCKILRAFISLLDNSTSELNRFPVAGDVKSQLVQLKRQTKTLMGYLRRLMLVITLVSIYLVLLIEKIP